VPEATLYVIPGSHPCRTGMLMLEHKGIPYRRVDLIAGLQPWIVRLLGFPGGARRTHTLGEGRHRNLAAADRMGTVPALRYDGRKVQTNREISRFLDQVKPDPPLFPRDSGHRRAVEEAELWGDEDLQMAARRIVLGGALRPGGLRDDGERGRMGHLLYKRRWVRKLVAPQIGRRVFAVDEAADRRLLDDLPAMLDRVDEWVAGGVLNGDELNAADYMIVSSLALLTYRTDVEPLVTSRPAGALVDRVLPEPPA
jgi:glutathione S-transferase